MAMVLQHGRRLQQPRAIPDQQTRYISQWFRYADEEIRKRSGDFIRRPRFPPIVRVNALDDRGKSLDEKAARVVDAVTEAEIRRRNVNNIGFEKERWAAIDDMRWVPTEQDCAQGTVALIWDVHNKPEGMSPLGAAVRVIDIARVFGTVVDMTAYVSRRMLCYLPLFTREYNRAQRPVIVNGELRRVEPYKCGVCGTRKNDHVSLIIHFREKHERVRTERIRRMRHSDSKKERADMRKILLYEEDKYREAARKALMPRVLLPDGLPIALVKAGYSVRQMHDKPPKAPDFATWTHICQVANLGVSCIVLVCDNSNYTGAMDFARRLNRHTVLIGVGNRQEIKAKVNLHMTWEDVVTGRGMALAEQTAAAWAAAAVDEDLKNEENKKRPYAVEKDDMFFEYYEDLYPSSELESDGESESEAE